MKNEKKINIAIVDDHALFRNGLKLLINSHESFNVIAEASNGIEFIKTLDVIPIDIALMDISMPEMDGVETTRIALSKHPDLKVIALSMYGDESYYFKMLEAGACGFLLKESDIDEVFVALSSVMEGKSYFSQMLLQNLINLIKNSPQKPDKTDDLSEREIDIISLVCRGNSNSEIAEKLSLSKRTVEKHRSNILFKTNSKNTAALVVYAIKNVIVEI